MKHSQGHYTILENAPVKGRFYHLVLEAPDIAAAVTPGQFVNIRVTQDLEVVFRRPFSVYRSLNGKIELLYDVVGKGTELLAAKTPGDQLDIIGPLGNGFTLPGQSVKTVVMIAGGIGVAPFAALSDAVKEHNAKKILLYGGRTKEAVCDMDVFKENYCEVHIATDDGTAGIKGRVSVLFSRIPIDGETMIYTCGPRPMMRGVQEFVVEHDLNAQCSCEEVMACGVGACLGCVIATKKGYRTVCHDGPIFDLQDVIFER